MAEVTTAVLLIIGKIQEKIIERKAINDCKWQYVMTRLISALYSKK